MIGETKEGWAKLEQKANSEHTEILDLLDDQEEEKHVTHIDP